jgi:hypothetical protein
MLQHMEFWDLYLAPRSILLTVPHLIQDIFGLNLWRDAIKAQLFRVIFSRQRLGKLPSRNSSSVVRRYMSCTADNCLEQNPY